MVLGGTPAEAANGDPVLAGRSNAASNTTALTNAAPVPSVQVTSANASGAAHGLIVVAKNGYGISASSTGNHALSGTTAAATKSGVIATHTGPAGTGAALIASGRKNTGAYVYNADTDKPALLVKSTWASPAGKSGSAISATGNAQHGAGVRAEMLGGGHTAAAVRGVAREGALAGDFVSSVVVEEEASIDASNFPVAIAASAHGTVIRRDGTVDIFSGKVFAGYGDVEVNGELIVTAGAARIDDPANPGSNYLNHPFVSSDELTNVYSGTAKADASGEAVVRMPYWFELINTNVRYQLTAIGAPAPELHVKTKVSGGTFTIAGAKPQQEICWELTGRRTDPAAEAIRVPTVRAKPEKERGTYLYPKGFGQPGDKPFGYRDPS